jgi:hypothetical protein
MPFASVFLLVSLLVLICVWMYCQSQCVVLTLGKKFALLHVYGIDAVPGIPKTDMTARS